MSKWKTELNFGYTYQYIWEKINGRFFFLFVFLDRHLSLTYSGTEIILGHIMRMEFSR